jgi:hypothetical protein
VCELHAPRAPSPVAIVEVEPFALQDECSDAILVAVSICWVHRLNGEVHTCDLVIERVADRGMLPATVRQGWIQDGLGAGQLRIDH